MREKWVREKEKYEENEGIREMEDSLRAEREREREKEEKWCLG